MKKLITFIFFSLFCMLTISGQNSEESREKIKALKVSFLTEELNLTSTEAQKFWPIYNAYDKEHRTLRNKYKDEIKKAIKSKGEIDSLNEEDAAKLIALKITTDKYLYESERDFITKVKKVISYKKIIKLQIAEMEFGRKLMNRYRRKKED